MNGLNVSFSLIGPSLLHKQEVVHCRGELADGWKGVASNGTKQYTISRNGSICVCCHTSHCRCSFEISANVLRAAGKDSAAMQAAEFDLGPETTDAAIPSTASTHSTSDAATHTTCTKRRK
jgi:hypothetical protein